jgi:hypothetical protein
MFKMILPMKVILFTLIDMSRLMSMRNNVLTLAQQHALPFHTTALIGAMVTVRKTKFQGESEMRRLFAAA